MRRAPRRHLRAGLVLVLAVVAGLAVAGGTPTSAARAASPRSGAALAARLSRLDLRRSPFQAAAWPGRPFSAHSVWNEPLGADAPLDSRSSAYVTELLRQVHDYHPWLNTTSYSVPVYVVGPRQPTVKVTLDTWGPDLQTAFDAVPIPAAAQAAPGTDKHMTVWQPSTDRLWDFWLMRRVGGRWHARWGGEMDHVSRSPGYFTHTGTTGNWGATATGLPLLGGLVTFADLERGSIDHALAISLVETEPADFSWPAQRTDGYEFARRAAEIPEGMRFRLNPRIDVARLDLPPLDRMLALAAQRYGIVVRDKAGAVAFYGQQPVGVPNPWPAAFGNQWPNQVLEQFPWSDLQALRPRMSCCWTATAARAAAAARSKARAHARS